METGGGSGNDGRGRGCIYLQANDAVYDWTKAWFSSLEYWRCQLPVIIIPWDRNVSRIEAEFCGSGRASMMSETKQAELLEQVERIAQALYPDGPKGKWPLFRRLAPFWGEHEAFLFSDADIVFLSNPEELLSAFLAKTQAPFCYLSRSVGFVYGDEDFRRRMVEENGSREFNAGFWAGRRGSLDYPMILDLAQRARAERVPLRWDMYDQAFMNYCVDTLRLDRVSFADVMPGLAESIWPNPRREGKLVRRDERYFWDASCDESNRDRQVVLLHWAGFKCNVGMPFREVFLQYRLGGVGSLRRAAYHVRAVLEYVPVWLSRYLRPVVRRIRGNPSGMC